MDPKIPGAYVSFRGDADDGNKEQGVLDGMREAYDLLDDQHVHNHLCKALYEDRWSDHL